MILSRQVWGAALTRRLKPALSLQGLLQDDHGCAPSGFNELQEVLKINREAVKVVLVELCAALLLRRDIVLDPLAREDVLLLNVHGAGQQLEVG